MLAWGWSWPIRTRKRLACLTRPTRSWAWTSADFVANLTAGFSLGEYAALVYAGVLRFEESVKLVQRRGLFMQNAVPQGLGKMCWISGLDRSTVQQIVSEASHLGLIECSNFNCPNQIIVAGYSAAVEKAAELANLRGAIATTFLNVSGPFHTSLLKGAGALGGLCQHHA